uniref:Neur_chan_LBD domain-containing protein n=1 Tax=Panagrellus redivivus TaxID=6233 RepID=A0A7E4VLR2_PANRE
MSIRICILLCLVILTECRSRPPVIIRSIPTLEEVGLTPVDYTNQTQIKDRFFLDHEKYFMRVYGEFFCDGWPYRKRPKDPIEFWNNNDPFPETLIRHGYLDDNGVLDIVLQDYDYITGPRLEVQFFMNYTCGCQSKFVSRYYAMKWQLSYPDPEEAKKWPFSVGKICLDRHCTYSEYWRWDSQICTFVGPG